MAWSRSTANGHIAPAAQEALCRMADASPAMAAGETPRHNAIANIPRRCIVRSPLLSIAPWWICAWGPHQRTQLNKTGRPRFGDSVDPNQGYLILAVQPVGGI